MLERGEGEKKKEIDSSVRLLAIPSSMLDFILYFEETSILKNSKVMSPRKIRYFFATVLPDEASVAGGQVCHTTLANRSHLAIPPSARHPSIWHKPLKPIPHHRE